MPTYRFRGRDIEGREIAGDLGAVNIDAARAELSDRGLETIELSVADRAVDEAVPVRPLSADESAEITEQIAQLSAAELPLSPGLRAAADEMASGRAALVLRSIAKRLDDGQSLEEIVSSLDGVFPKHFARLITVASRSGKLGHALAQLVEHQRAASELRWTVVAGLAYPVIVCCLAFCVLLFIILFLSSSFDRMFEQFGLELPLVTRLFFWWRDIGLPLMGCFLIAGGCVTVVLKRTGGQVAWLRMIGKTPFFGSLSLWMAVAEWSSLLSVLIKNQIPLPEALRLAGEGIGNAHFGQLSVGLAGNVEQGQALSQALSTDRQFPATLVPIVRWGEESGMLGETFATSSEMFSRRVRTRSLIMRSILPSMLFIGIGSCALFVVYGLFSPLSSLIRGLS